MGTEEAGRGRDKHGFWHPVNNYVGFYTRFSSSASSHEVRYEKISEPSGELPKERKEKVKVRGGCVGCLLSPTGVEWDGVICWKSELSGSAGPGQMISELSGGQRNVFFYFSLILRFYY